MRSTGRHPSDIRENKKRFSGILSVLLICTFIMSWESQALTAAAEPLTSGEASSGTETSHDTETSPDTETSSDNTEESSAADDSDPDYDDDDGLYFAPSYDPFHNGGSYSAFLYNSTNGLPTSEANAIAQTSDGFIWIGSYGGLVRYDGYRFEQIEIDKTMSGVKSLFVDSKDRLWIGSSNNGIAVMDNGEFTYWYSSDGLPSGSINGMQEDNNGVIYAATREGVMTVDKELKLSRFDDERINSKNVIDIKKGDGGYIYCLTDRGDLFAINDGTITYYQEGDVSYSYTCLIPYPGEPGYVYIGEGNLVYVHELENMHVLDDGGGFYVTGPSFSSFTGVEQILNMEYIDGEIWVLSRKGIGVNSLTDNTYYILDDVPMTSSVDHVMKDFQGNYWFTSASQGVVKIVPNRFGYILEKYGISETVVNTTCMYNDELFVGTDTGLIVINEDGVMNDYKVQEKLSGESKPVETDLIQDILSDDRIRSIVRDSKNRLWISTWGKGVFCLDKTIMRHYNTFGDDLISDNIRTVCERKDGSFCAVGSGGADIIKDEKVIKRYSTEEGLKNASILTAAENSNGDTILGSDGGGLYILNDKGVKNIGLDDGLTSGIVMRIKRDRTRNIFWLVTNNSISYMTEDYKITEVSTFPYSNNFDIYQNSKDEMWVLCSKGVFIVPTEQMINDAVVDPDLYTVTNGLPCIATANSYSELTENGDLYISGATGVVKVNIESDDIYSTEYKLAVPYLEADGERIFPDEDGNFAVSSDVKKLTIYAHAINFSLTDPVIYYCLEGFDSDEIMLNPGDSLSVDYTNLAGGKYSFVLNVSDPMRRGQKSLSVKITKERKFYEEAGFWIFAVLAGILVIAGILVLIIHFRVNKLNKKNRESMLLVHEISEAFAKVIDMKDAYTNGHSSRVAKYTEMLAEELGYNKETIEKFYHIALLHDIGKVGVPSEVLNKPGKLTDEEFEMIKSHTTLGYDTLEGISIMPELALGAKCHHERPDGKGYPGHLKGDEIPRVAQIIAVADCFDAMYSNRPYRKRMNFEKAVSIIKNASGTQLAPDVVEAFLRLVDRGEFRAPDDEGGGTTENIENIRGS